MSDELLNLDEYSDSTIDNLATETVSIDGRELYLGELLQDILGAHNELDQYKAGGLSNSQILNEKLEDVDEENEELRSLIEGMADSAFAIYLRLERGDLELSGNRDGEYSDFLKV